VSPSETTAKSKNEKLAGGERKGVKLSLIMLKE
jgi:hypothetical protein